MTPDAPGSSRRGLVGLATAFVAAAAAPTHAATNADERPFAEHHLVLQISDGDAAKQALVVSVAYNMLSVYGPDAIAIEVVAFAEGIDLLRADSSEREHVDSLIAQGVQFDVCMNTVHTIERKTGKPVALNPQVRPVDAGVATILSLVEHGYTLVRP